MKKLKLLAIIGILLLCVFALFACDVDKQRPNTEQTTEPEGEAVGSGDEAVGSGDETSVHVHTEVVDNAVTPTCTESGLTMGKHCSVCGEVLVAQQAISALGHVEMTTPAKTPTCSESGLTRGIYCVVCNEILAAQQEIPTLPHTEVVDAAVAATCVTTGLTEGSHCSVCGETLIVQMVIEKTNIHIEAVDPSVAPTCTATGLTEGSHCSVCSKVLVAQNVIAATANHTYGSNKLCSVCGSPKPSEGLEFTSNGDGTCALTGIGTCTSTDLVIPTHSPEGDLVTSIGKSAFNIGYKKGVLTSVIIPDSVKSIESAAFCNNPKIKSVTLHEGLLSIGDMAFGSCKSLTEIVIPSSVTSIGEWGFCGCESLKRVTFPTGDISLGRNLFAACYALTDVTLPEGLTSIAEGLFYNCESLERVTIPGSVTSIGTTVFWQCEKLKTIVFGGTEAQWNALEKGSQWDQGSGNYYVEFSNGDQSDLKDPIPEGACVNCKGEGWVVCPRCKGSLIAEGVNSEGNSVFIKCPSCTVANTWYKCTDCKGTGSATGGSSGGSSSGGSSSGGSSSSGSTSCYYCYGTGKIECIGCDGTGQVLKYYANHRPVYGACIACRGSGKGTCYYCGGDGKY